MSPDILVSTDQAKLDRPLIHSILKNSYWCMGISSAVVDSAIDGSLCFGLYLRNQQIGFARVISDYSTFAYLCDVFILENFRNQGYSKRLLKEVINHSSIQGLRRFCLVTKTAHNLYKKFGFSKLKDSGLWMEISDSEIYLKAGEII